MPRQGRPAAPTALKVLRGDRTSRINHSAPVPASEEPTPPAWLEDDSDVEEFERIAGQLYRAGIAKGIDSDAVAHYVVAQHVYRDARSLVRQAGILVRDGDTARRNPAVLVMRQWSEECRRWAVEIGYTASARDSLHTARPPLGLRAERLLT